MHFERMDVPPKAGPGVPILRVKAGQHFLFVALAMKIAGFMAHWSGKASVPCTGDDPPCPGCNARPPWDSRWKGYIHVLEMSSKAEGFLEITPASAEMLQLQSVNPLSLRGTIFEAMRTSANNGRLKLIYKSVFPRLADLPAEKDPTEALKRLWGIKQ